MGIMSWFWRHAPRSQETVWSSFNEEDGIEVLRSELGRIADALELLVKK
jgi:hypothetical protein